MKQVNVVSIPQAVSAVATGKDGGDIVEVPYGFNTASGKCCCNKNN